MGSDRDDDAITQVMRAARAAEAVRRERALQPIRDHHHPLASEVDEHAPPEPPRVVPPAVDPRAIDSFSELASALARTRGAARVIGASVDALLEAAVDPGCLVVGAFEEDLEDAGHEGLAASMVAWGWLDVVVLDGVNLLGEADRVRAIVDAWPEGRAMASGALCAALGEALAAVRPDALLAAAWRRQVPVVVPALAETALGEVVSAVNRARRRAGRAGVVVDPFADHDAVRARIERVGAAALFSVGGGFPRAFATRLVPSPQIDIRLATRDAGVGWPLLVLAARERQGVASVR